MMNEEAEDTRGQSRLWQLMDDDVKGQRWCLAGAKHAGRQCSCRQDRP